MAAYLCMAEGMCAMRAMLRFRMWQSVDNEQRLRECYGIRKALGMSRKCLTKDPK